MPFCDAFVVVSRVYSITNIRGEMARQETTVHDRPQPCIHSNIQFSLLSYFKLVVSPCELWLIKLTHNLRDNKARTHRNFVCISIFDMME